MSPSGGAMTTVDPSMTWSPEKSMCSSTSSQHRWFEAWPGVCSGPQGEARPAQLEAVTHGPGRARSRRAAQKPSTSAPVRAARPAAPGRVVGMGVGDDDPADPARPELGQRVQMAGVVGTGVDHDQRRRSPPGRCWSPGRSSCPGWGP